MRTSTILALASAVAGSVIEKRQTPNIDAVILNYALTLEHLEAVFYANGLQNFTQAQFAAAGFDATFYRNLKEIASDEATHVDFLTKGLTAAGAQPVAACQYKFPYTDPKSFVSLASVLEGVGVSAYLGAAQNITDPDYLTAAGSILTVEARHNAYIRAALQASPFPTPFDTPLDFNQVYSLAAPFIVSCPSTNPALPVKAFPSLTLTSGGHVPEDFTGDYLTFVSATPLQANTAYYLHFLNGLDDIPVKAYVGAGNMVSANIPAGVAGQTYVILTPSADDVTDASTLAGPAIIDVADCVC